MPAMSPAVVETPFSARRTAEVARGSRRTTSPSPRIHPSLGGSSRNRFCHRRMGVLRSEVPAANSSDRRLPCTSAVPRNGLPLRARGTGHSSRPSCLRNRGTGRLRSGQEPQFLTIPTVPPHHRWPPPLRDDPATCRSEAPSAVAAQKAAPVVDFHTAPPSKEAQMGPCASRPLGRWTHPAARGPRHGGLDHAGLRPPQPLPPRGANGRGVDRRRRQRTVRGAEPGRPRRARAQLRMALLRGPRPAYAEGTATGPSDDFCHRGGGPTASSAGAPCRA